DVGAAIEEYRTALQLDPLNADTHNGYGRFLDLIGRHEEAAQELKRAFELDPQSVEVRNSMAHLLLDQNEVDAAARLMDSKDTDDEDSLITLGMITERRARRSGGSPADQLAAQQFYEKALADNPKSDDAHYRLGTLLWPLGRSEEAAMHFEESLR